MKTAFMFVMTISLLLVMACRTEESVPVSVDDPFFSLKVGNQWVYKTYNSPDFTNPQSVTTFTGRVDFVSIVSTTNIQGFTLAKHRTKIHFPNSNLNGNVSYRYLRVNTQGHLVSYPV